MAINPEIMKHLNEEMDRHAAFLSYDRCTTQELRSFCYHRGIVVNDKSAKARPKLIRRLKRKDKKATFHSFTALPAELRLEIYKYHFAAVQIQAASLPLAPPLCQVSRWVREETLALFYQMCTVYLQAPLYLYDPAAEPLLSLQYGAYTRWLFLFANHEASTLFSRAPSYVRENLGSFRLYGGLYTLSPCGVRVVWEATVSPRDGEVRLVEVEVEDVFPDCGEWMDYRGKACERHGELVAYGLRALLGRDETQSRLQSSAQTNEEDESDGGVKLE